VQGRLLAVLAIALAAACRTASAPSGNDVPASAIRISLPDRARVEVWRIDAVPVLVHRATLDAGEQRLLIRVPPGDYRIAVRGRRPFQKFGKRIVLPAPDAAVDVRVFVETSPLALRVNGDRPVKVDVRHATGGWQEQLELAAGRPHHFDLWQQGALVAIVRVPGVTNPYTEQHALQGNGPLAWDIDPRGATVRGTIMSATGGTPVADAAIVLTVVDEAGGRRPLTTRSDARGAFAFDFVARGRHRMLVTSSSHADHQDDVVVPDDATPIDIPIVLPAAVRQPIRVVDAAGHAVEAVIFGADREWPLGKTDGSGEITLPLHGRLQSLFVIGTRRSFAIASLVPSTDRLTISLPAPSANLHIKATSGTGAPVPRVGFSIRYRGHLLPPHVVRGLAQLQGIRFATGTDGTAYLAGVPPGHYELWPRFGTPSVRGAGQDFGAAPIQVQAEPGTTEVALLFSAEN
jgi:Carboxypeptidase regulatory-like domain